MSTAACESGAAGRVKVLLWCRYADDADLVEIERRFDQTGELLRGTPGLLGSELLVSISAPGGCVVLSEWASRDEFEEWERSKNHRGQTAGMRPFQDQRRSPVFDVLQVSRTHNAHSGLTRFEENVDKDGKSGVSAETACVCDA